MKHWTGDSVFQDPTSTDVIREATEALVAEYAAIESGGYPRLVSVSQSQGDDDSHQYEVVVELAPGVVLPAECGLMESINEGWDEPVDASDVVAWTMEGVKACMPMVDRLSDQLHDVRMRARQMIDGWLATHVRSRLVEVRLAPYDSWRGLTDPAMTLLVEGCDELLRTSVEDIHLENAADLDRGLANFGGGLSIRLEARARLAQLGADGEIDQLALNAIAHFGDVAETLRRFGSEWRFWLPDSTALVTHHGRVTAGSGELNPAVDFARGRVTFTGIQLPETALIAATGRPVTDIAEHPFLSDDMTLIEATSWVDDDDTPMITFKLDMPQWLFCTATGRTWLRDAPAGSRDNVVALDALAS